MLLPFLKRILHSKHGFPLGQITQSTRSTSGGKSMEIVQRKLFPRILCILNNFITANIPRVVSNSYCGSDMGESDIYSSYSYFAGSETTAADLANDNDSVWGMPAPLVIIFLKFL